jgi:hypothetical protein
LHAKENYETEAGMIGGEQTAEESHQQMFIFWLTRNGWATNVVESAP